MTTLATRPSAGIVRVVLPNGQDLAQNLLLEAESIIVVTGKYFTSDCDRMMQFRLNTTYVILPVFVLIALLLRISGLEALDFGPDELLHIYAANEIMEGRPPVLPSGVLYDRALPYTILLAAIGNLFGLTEWTARLPSVIFGVLTVVVVYVMGRAWYSTTAGLTAAFLIAVAPSAIEFSQEVRMYAAFQFFYLLTIYFFMRGLEPVSRAVHQPKRGYYQGLAGSLNVDPLPLIASGVCLFAAYKLHTLIVPAMLGPLAYVICMGVLSSTTKQTPRAKYGLILVATALTAVVTVILRPEMPQRYLQLAANAPPWADQHLTNWRYYIRYLQEYYPIIFGTLAIAAFYALLQKPKVTFFLLCCLVVPLILHSFALAWKVDRYIFQLLPVMYLLWAPGATALVLFLHATAVGAISRYLRPAHAHLAGGVLVIASVLVTLSVTPWFFAPTYANLLDLPLRKITQHEHWKAAMTYVRAHAHSGEVIITPFALLARYYGPQLPIYHLNPQMMFDIRNHNLRDEVGRFLEPTGGAPVITDLATLRNVLADHQGAWIVRERRRFYARKSVPVDIREHIESTCQLQKVPAAPDMMIWHCGR